MKKAFTEDSFLLIIIIVASIIIKLTPNVKDDAWLKKILKFTGKFVALNRK